MRRVLARRLSRLLHIVAIAVLLGALLADMTSPPAARAEGPNAILNLPGCTTNALIRTDDGGSRQAQLGFTMNFFGTNYSSVWVNNNGNVTFTAASSSYLPFDLTSTTTPIIAAYFDDIDTRNTATQPVTYGTTQYGGRNAFCVNWVNVGQFPSRADQLNSFQLLIVDRSDIGAGGFDLYLNYDKIQFNQRNAGVGYAKGTPSDPNSFFQFPGSRTAGAFVDSNTTNGLIRSSRGTPQLGRYLFEVRNGAIPVGGQFVGKVTNNQGQPLAGARVQACQNANPSPCVASSTNSAGDYVLTGVPVFAPGYGLTVFPPAGVNLVTNVLGPIHVTANQNTTQNVTLLPLVPTPAGTSFTGPGVLSTTSGVPVLQRGTPFTISTTQTRNCSVGYDFILNGQVIQQGAMTETPAGSGIYTASVTLPPGIHGFGEFRFRVTCGSTTTTVPGGSVWIDPSGFVRTTAGTPIVGATVTLFRSDNSAGPFTQVPNGSDIMSPGNRENPDTTDSIGHFGWDVIAGYYKVRAEKAGCTAPGNPNQAFAETAVLPIPPPVFDLDIRLDCGGAPPPPNVCNPRPPVRIATQLTGDGRIRVSVSAGNGSLTQLQFNTDPARVPSPNAVVQISEGTINGNIVTLPANITSTAFHVRRQTTGSTTVPFVATDGCGEWRTFVGFGANVNP